MSKPKLSTLLTTWYCVIRVADFDTVYIGRDKLQAHAANTEGTVIESGHTSGEAERNAAIAAGQAKTALVRARTKSPPREVE